MEDAQKQFAERLTLLRKSQGMTQQTVAEILNVSRPAYAYYELGKSSPSLESLRRLVRLFCPSSPQFLMALDEQPAAALREKNRSNKSLPVFAELTPDEQRVVGMYRVMDAESKAEARRLLSALLNS